MSEHGPHPAEHARRLDPALVRYLTVYAILVVLLVVTIGAAFMHLGILAIAVALLIAGVKAALVALYFMHVKEASLTTKVFVIAGLFWLGILFALTFSDYFTRGWLPLSQGWTRSPVIPPPAGTPRPEQTPEPATETATPP